MAHPGDFCHSGCRFRVLDDGGDDLQYDRR